MIFDLKLNNGILLGIVQEPLMVVSEDEQEMSLASCISIHLTIFSIMLIFT